MKNKGISLIVLIVTIIVVIILAAVVILTISKDGGIINKARYAKDEYNKIEYRDRINEAYTIVKNKQEMQGKSDREIFEEVKKSLNFEKAKYEISEKSMNITTKEGYEYTLLGDGYIYDEKVVVLDIAEGNIDLYSNGYKQYTGALQGLNQNGATSFTGKYIITGTTTENVVRVCDVGNYNITIKDLNIDVEGKHPIICNAKKSPNDVNVNLFLDGDNKLTTTSSPCLSFDIGNTTQRTNSSTITFNGEGNLTANVIGNQLGAVIGSSYGGGGTFNNFNANLIINSGTFNIGSSYNGASIGSGYRGSGFFITINGGKIYANGGAYGGAIGGRDGDGKVTINGGYIKTTGNSIIGYKWRNVEINGGTIDTGMVSCKTGGNINITGGNMLAIGKNNLNIATYQEGTSNLIAYTPNNGTNNIYETKIKLQNIGENKKIESITTSDNIAYGIKDMYTLEDGMLYLYLPLGKREITIKVNGKTYKGEVETTENENNKVLNEE